MGCCAQKKNICRAVLPLELASRLDALAVRLSAWVDALGVATASLAESLLLCRSIRGEEAAEALQQDFVVLLVDAVYKPKHQYFVYCYLEDDREERVELPFPQDELPVVVRIAERPSRLSRQGRALDICTSDELCKRMADTAET